jgi:hypothetical protein
MDKEVKSMFRTMAIVIAFLLIVSNICKAQGQHAVSINTQADMVSSYVWRGMYQSGAAVQPTLGMNAGNFSLSAWGSVDVTGQGHKEVDLTASYSTNGITASLTDYWWAGQSGIYNNRVNGENKYFHLSNHNTDHILEAGLSYVLPIKRLPLSLSWYTMIWGADKKSDSNMKIKNAYSSYGEVSCPFTVQNTNLLASVGFSPFDSPANYKNNGFAVTNIAIKASKEIQITDKFSLPVFGQVIWNPNREDVHFVFGVTLK